ncbi:MAG TPA: gliding motility-associated C-terminal domain-containing protein [Saprospiraceae bacterium]|nr:gliding motility-associated C-terminal domain-containing protein [Saprospiraceae bacterium]
MRTYLILILISISAFLAAQTTENCSNGLDDDADGLIDCYDVADCPCASVHDCTLEKTRLPRNLELKWSHSSVIANQRTPIVGNLNPWVDDIPEIILTITFNSMGNEWIEIMSGDGSNSATPDKLFVGVNNIGLYQIPFIADLDRNGVPELIITGTDKKIKVFTQYTPGANPPMQLWMESVDTVASATYLSYPADFDGDGISEIYAGNEVFGLDFSNPAAPALKLLAKGTGPNGSIIGRLTSPIAADLLDPADCNGDPDCAGLELAAGFGIYSVDIDPNDGDGMELKLQRDINNTSGQNFGDGYTAVADLNLDGILEVAVTGTRNQQLGVYVWNKTGFWRFFSMGFNSLGTWDGMGACSVHNVFDDRTQGFAEDWPEILVRYDKRVRCFSLHAQMANAGAPFWWSSDGLLIDDPSGKGAPTCFDFDNNGLAEVLIQDETKLYMLYGGSAPFPPGVGANRVITSFPARGNTHLESPVVADVDGDGLTEILAYDFTIINNVGMSTQLVLTPQNPDYSHWLPARKVWNQYNYFPAGINDDLTVPAVQQNSALEWPGPGSGKRPLNIFLSQIPAYFHPDGDPYTPSADLTVEVESAICMLPQFQVTLRICNQGEMPSADTTKVRFYRGGNPFVVPTSNSFGGIFTVSTQAIPPDSCFTYTLNLPVASGNIYAVLNDWGNFPTPLPGGDTLFYRQECDLANNVDVFTMNLSNGLPLSLGPDRVYCAGNTLTLSATPGFNTYLWQNGATAASIQVGAPGLYWVEARDLCFNIRRDTVLLTPGESFQTIQATACAGTFFTYNAQNIPAGDTQQFTFTNALGCDSIVTVVVDLLPQDTLAETRQICAGDSTLVFGAYVQTAGQYSQTFTNQFGCDSLYLIEVQVTTAVPPTGETRQICAGDSTLVFGSYVQAAGAYPQTFSSVSGCDSVHTITVQLLPTPLPTGETRQICPGDSTLVFGAYVKTAGAYPQTFSSTSGCDSVHTITVQLLPAPVPTGETRQICAGDSTLVFGAYVQTAGVYPQTFSSVNGCDSVHTITVQLLPLPAPTGETRQICAGDSTLVFGAYVQTAGVYPQTFSSASGCDSVHTITVQLLPTSVPTDETRQICAGDSTLVFGAYVQTAGVYPQTFSSASGCDSVHTITVLLLPTPVPTGETRQICAGDSTLVFGAYVKTAGTYPQTFSSVNGCDSVHTITVLLLPTPVPTGETRQICAGDSTLVFGAYVKIAGDYPQTFSSVNGCDSVHTITVQLLPTPAPTSETRQICAGDSTLVFGTYVQTAGVYSQLFSNAQGCDSTHSITVALLAEWERHDSLLLCAGDSVLVQGQWIAAPGAYPFLLPALNGCDTLWLVNIQEIQSTAPVWQIQQPNANQSTGTLQITGPAGATYSLDGLQYSSATEFQGLLPGQYRLYQQEQGCITQYPFEVLAWQEEQSDGVYAPNIFAPDAGGDNARFTLFTGQAGQRSILWLQVYDRWGSLVFSGENIAFNAPASGWDGLVQGKNAAPGVYFWQAMILQENGAQELFKGDLTLIR